MPLDYLEKPRKNHSCFLLLTFKKERNIHDSRLRDIHDLRLGDIHDSILRKTTTNPPKINKQTYGKNLVVYGPRAKPSIRAACPLSKSGECGSSGLISTRGLSSLIRPAASMIADTPVFVTRTKSRRVSIARNEANAKCSIGAELLPNQPSPAMETKRFGFCRATS